MLIDNIKNILSSCLYSSKGIEISESFLSPIMYSILASYAKSKWLKVHFLDTTVRSFMNQNKFNSKVWQPSYVRWGMSNNGALSFLNSINTIWSVDESVALVEEWVRKYLDDKSLPCEWVENYWYILRELISNLDDHSGDYMTNFISSQYYPNKRYFELAVVDSGRWIYNSLETAGHKIFSHKDAIGKSLEPRMSWGDTKPSSSNWWMTKNAWMGLSVLSELIKLNGWDMVVWSWNYMHVIDRKDLENSTSGYFTKLPIYWKGTFIVIRLYSDDSHNLSYTHAIDSIDPIGSSNISHKIKFIK